MGGKRGAGLPEYGVPECEKRGVWKTRFLVKNKGAGGKRRVSVENTGSKWKTKVNITSFNYEFSSFKWKVDIHYFFISNCKGNQFSISARHGTLFRSLKQIKHFVMKETIQMSTCRAVIFNALYFSILRPKMIFPYQFLKAFVACIATRLICWAYHPRFVKCFDYIHGNRFAIVSME